MLRNIATLVVAVEVVVDILAILVLVLALDPGFKQFALTWWAILTIAADVIIVVYAFFGMPGIVMTARGLRGVIFSATIAIALTLMALVLIWIPLGLPFWWTWGILLVLLIGTLIEDSETARRIIG